MKFYSPLTAEFFPQMNRTGEDESYNEYEAIQWTAMICCNTQTLLMRL